MATASTHKVISAEDANDGGTVYLTSCDAWTPDVAIAELLESDDEGWRLAFANRLREVVNPNLVGARENTLGLAELAA